MAVAEPFVGARPVWRRPLTVNFRAPRTWSIVGASLFLVVTVIVLAAPLLSPHDPLTPVGIPLAAPGHGGFLLGSDSIGRDVLSRCLYGARASWFAALVVIAGGFLIGGLVGLVAGASGGWIDNLLMRITDGFLALPAPVLAIAVVASLGPSFTHTLIAVSIVWWPFYARIVRGEISKLAARPHVEAARLAGAGRIRIAVRHLLPGALPAAVVTASLDVGNLVLALAGLSFLGLGQSAPAPELGADSARNLSLLLQQWWVPVMPGIVLAVLAVIANIAGDSVRNLIDPE
ncbi:MAG: transporter permease [Marmoricola sp.]|nr:transporter permease [Marmoricola sp.]